MRPPTTDSKVPENQMKANLKIMDHIIKKYRPRTDKYDVGVHDMSKMTDEQKTEKESVGLESIAKHLGTLSNGRLDLSEIRAPQKKLYVMIIGNHSAGKSSFINWYIGEKLQRT